VEGQVGTYRNNTLPLKAAAKPSGLVQGSCQTQKKTPKKPQKPKRKKKKKKKKHTKKKKKKKKTYRRNG